MSFEMGLSRLLPRPTRSGVVGPPKLKMPQEGSDPMPRMSELMPKSSLGKSVLPLPKTPSLKPGPSVTPSLFHSKGPKHGFDSIK